MWYKLLKPLKYTRFSLYLTVKCPQGRYFSGSACLMCEDGHYQDLTGQTSCKSCGGNSVSSVNKTTCIGMHLF